LITSILRENFSWVSVFNHSHFSHAENLQLLTCSILVRCRWAIFSYRSNSYGLILLGYIFVRWTKSFYWIVCLSSFI